MREHQDTTRALKTTTGTLLIQMPANENKRTLRTAAPNGVFVSKIRHHGTNMARVEEMPALGKSHVIAPSRPCGSPSCSFLLVAMAAQIEDALAADERAVRGED